MKNLFIALAACIASMSLYAQTETNETAESLKASKKNWVTELNINPFQGSLSLNNSLNQIKVRKFLQDNLALRVGFNANHSSSNQEKGSPYGPNPSIYGNTQSTTTLGLNIGLEKHFSGTRRLSPYLGLDLALGNKSTEQEFKSGMSTTTIKGAWQNFSYAGTRYEPSTGTYHPIYESAVTEQAYLSFGLNVTSGFDFYVSKNFFLGYEFNFGFNILNYKDITVSQTGQTNSPAYDQKNNALKFGPSLINGIRLGYVIK